MKARAIFALAALAAAGCAGMSPAHNPMASVQAPAAVEPRCVLVLLPGAGDHAQVYEQQGFLKALAQRRLPVAVAVADATLGYYLQNSFQVRLAEDVVKPLRAKHPQAQLWLSGMSMGGFGSLMYAMNHPGEVAGVFAMAPFLGDAAIAAEVRAAGGLRTWQAPAAEKATNGNYQPQLWRWLKEQTTPGAKGTAIYLGYGVDDRLAVQGGVLASALPSGRVWLEPGGHVWEAWKPMFEKFLDSHDFLAACGPESAGAQPTPAASR